MSIFNLTVMAIDRYLAFCWPLAYLKIESTHRKAVFITLFAATFLIFCLPLLLFVKYDNGSCTVNLSKSSTIRKFTSISWVSTLFILPFLVIVTSYTLILVKLSSGNKADSTLTTSTERVKERAEKKILFCALFSAIAFLICMTPDNVIHPLHAFTDFEYETYPWLYDFVTGLVVMNSCSNPFIYFCVMKKFRRNVRRMLLVSSV